MSLALAFGLGLHVWQPASAVPPAPGTPLLDFSDGENSSYLVTFLF